jgi:glutamine amidotransferase
MKVAVLDYGLGNLHSLVKALAGPGRVVTVETDAKSAVASDALVLPGVGAFGPAAAFIAPHRAHLVDALADGLPCLGICLGMQLLCEDSEEGPGSGLGVFPGRVTRLQAARVPQIGWNTLDAVTDEALTASGLSTAYFANGYACRIEDESMVTAWATHEADRFPVAARSDRTLGVQFHPEKSSGPGVRFVRHFLESLS